MDHQNSQALSSLGTIAILGCGNMGGAILGGLYSANAKVIACDASLEKLKILEDTFKKDAHKLETTQDIKLACENADIVIVAVKPNAVKSVLLEIKPSLKENCHIISVAAGVRICTFNEILPNYNISRVMPNLPAVIAEGMSAIYSSDIKDAKICEQIFMKIGKTVILEKENDLNSATAIGGSAPAFFALILESLADAGIALGLSKEDSLKIVLQTALGTSKLLQSREISPTKFIEMVSSPGGTTIEGLKVLEEKGVRKIFVDAARSASSRAETLSKLT